MGSTVISDNDALIAETEAGKDPLDSATVLNTSETADDNVESKQEKEQEGQQRRRRRRRIKYKTRRAKFICPDSGEEFDSFNKLAAHLVKTKLGITPSSCRKPLYTPEEAR